MTQTRELAELFVEKLAAKDVPKEMEVSLQHRLEGEKGLNRLAQIEQSNQKILDSYPPAQLAASIRLRYEQQRKTTRKSHLRYLIPTSAVVAVAAAALLIITIGKEVPLTIEKPQNLPTEYIGIKGSPQLHIHKKTEAGEIRINSGDNATQGDVLQIKFNSSSAKSLMICSVDGHGAVTLHYPEHESDSTSVRTNTKQVLSFGYELDDAPGFERFFMVWTLTNIPLDTQRILNTVKTLKNSESSKLQLEATLHYKDIIVKK